MARRRSFTVGREPIEFDLGGDEFRAPPVIASAALGALLDAQPQIGALLNGDTTITQGEQIDQVLKILDELFAAILTPDSAALFHDRLYSRERPLDLLREVVPCMEWLIEEYTDRPTQPSQPSSNGLSDGGTNSTAGALPAGSTPATSPLTGFSTSPTT